MRQARRTARRIALVGTVVLAVVSTFATQASANASLWLYPDSEDPRQGGHVVNGNELVLNVANASHGAGDTTAYAVQLLVAVSDPALLDSATLTFADGTSTILDSASLVSGTPAYPCSGREIPTHGIYPTSYTSVVVGDIPQNQVVPIQVDVAGADGLWLHFDAVGQGVKNHGSGCTDVFNALGHDVTVILGDGPGSASECPAVDIRKESSVRSAALGDEVDYAITVTNEGDCDLTEVVVTDSIPFVSDPDSGSEVPAVSIVAVDPSATTQTDTELSWFAATLAPEESLTITLTVLFDESLAEGSWVRNRACVVSAELEEAICAQATVSLGKEGDQDWGPRGPGFWCHQISLALDDRPSALLTLDEVGELWDQIRELSDVFDEIYSLATVDEVRDLLCAPQNAGGPDDKLARHLMTLWLNVASQLVDGDLTLDGLCAGSVELAEAVDTTLSINEVLRAAEEELGSAEPSRATLLFWKDVIDFINNSSVAPEGGCSTELGAESSGVTRRARRRN